MYWTVCLTIALICLSSAVVFSILRRKLNKGNVGAVDIPKVLCISVVIASAVMFLPIYHELFSKTPGGLIETILISIHNVIRLFVVDGEFDFIAEGLEKANLSGWVAELYSHLFAVLFVAAPLLTFSFVLSFFKNTVSYLRYFFHYNSDVFAFSQLNEKSLTLAESMCTGKKKCFLIFAGVDDEIDNELCNKAKALGAAMFRKDIVSINFRIHNPKRQLKIFAIGDDSSHNAHLAVKLIKLYHERRETDIYVFSTSPSTEMILSGALDEIYDSDGKIIKVRRINEVRALVNNLLFEFGYNSVFRTARNVEDGDKEINAIIVGLGLHGTEMLKSLAWFGQMDGYRLRIDAFDVDENAEEKFISQCPELMDPKFNGTYDNDGEVRCEIRIHSGVDAQTKTFDDILKSLPKPTYAFVALGEDEKNIAISVKLRSVLLRSGAATAIETVVYDSEKAEALRCVRNFKNQRYCIHFVGDLKSLYSEETIINSEIEELALARHMKWGSEREFWQYDYNYKSSVASAIHHKMKVLCGIPGADKSPDMRTKDELWAIRKLEHRRWNAYMRSEGYVFGGTVEPSGRNDLAKMHNCLVPFADLPLEIQEKDDD